MQHCKVQHQQKSHPETPAADTSHPADRHVGRQVALMRLQARMTQTKLATGLGISVQQLQKYEKAKNRVSASTLFDIGRFLDVPVSRFYQGLPGNNVGSGDVQAPPDDQVAFVASLEGQRLTNAYLALPPRLRQRVMSFVAGLGDDLQAIRELPCTPNSALPVEEGDT